MFSWYEKKRIEMPYTYILWISAEPLCGPLFPKFYWVWNFGWISCHRPYIQLASHVDDNRRVSSSRAGHPLLSLKSFSQPVQIFGCSRQVVYPYTLCLPCSWSDTIINYRYATLFEVLKSGMCDYRFYIFQGAEFTDSAHVQDDLCIIYNVVMGSITHWI